jgi:hypothetical protein
VSLDRLNFFEPFERLPPNHENQLTRALLVALRLSSAAHRCWLTRAKLEPRLLHGPLIFRTQRRAILDATDVGDPVPIVSVFLTPTAPVSEDVVVLESDRGQVLDAIIEYSIHKVVVVENKIGADDFEQARRINLGKGGVAISPGEEVRFVLWPDLLRDFAMLLEGDAVGGSEALVLRDFLRFVEDRFPRLGPYHSLGLARGDEFRVTRRLQDILAGVARQEVWIDRYGRPSMELPPLTGVAARAYLSLEHRGGDRFVEFSAYPADTLSQAREFYASQPKVEAVRKLADAQGWAVEPNFHFGHFEAGYVFCTSSIITDDYLDLWQREISTTASVPRTDWPRYLKWLSESGITNDGDEAEFHRHFTRTARQTASPRPGVALRRRWSLAEAEELDANGAFADEVADALSMTVAALKR